MARTKTIAKEFMPMSDEFCATITPRDQFLVRFPRSGSRWIQLLLTDLVNQLHRHDPAGIYCQQMYRELWQQDMMPDVDCYSRDEVLPQAVLEDRDVHEAGRRPVSPIFRSHNVKQITHQ